VVLIGQSLLLLDDSDANVAPQRDEAALAASNLNLKSIHVLSAQHLACVTSRPSSMHFTQQTEILEYMPFLFIIMNPA
jgi:hypothetical protein